MDYLLKNSIKTNLNISIEKIKITLEDSKQQIEKIFKEQNYNTKYINFQNNSINGVIERNKQKYFFKILNEQEFTREIRGYIEVKDILPVCKLLYIYELENYYIIIYEYEKTITNNEGLLNDFLVKNDIYIEEKSDEIIRKIVDLYNNSFKKTINKKNYPMDEFFIKRVQTRLKAWYNKEELFNYDININGLECKNTKKIIKETINYFSKNNKLECALTQGDPNTLNIAIKPIFFDFATAGLNPIICEFSAILWSVLIADAYFCPKYHKNSYYNHENVFNNVEKFMPNIEYKIDKENKKIQIKSNIKTSKIRKKFIISYIEMLENLNIKIGKEIIYYLIMRILCVFDISKMEEKDYFYSIYVLHYLYENISKDVYTSLKNIIEKFEEIGEK